MSSLPPSDPIHFDEALEWFRDRIPWTRSQWEALDAVARRQAFFVSGVAQADVVADVWESLDRAITNGESLEEWKATAGPLLEQAWAGSVDNPAWRLETIFRTNGLQAFNAGRHRQLTDPAILKDRPYWQFDATIDGRETDICDKCNGTVLPANHPWWATHWPLLHFNCRSGVTSLTEDEARAVGISVSPPSIEPDKGFGHLPEHVEWKPDPGSYPEPIGKILRSRISK